MPRAIAAILIAIAVAYAVTAFLGQSLAISGRLLVLAGGLVPLQWLDGAFWRFLSYGFLHGNLMHLLANATCLLAWGIPLERLLGAWRFMLLYLGAIVAGGLASVFTRDDVFVLIGASGGTSGLLGALFALRLLGRSGLPASFFAINIGLNIGLTLLLPDIDWRSHVGGVIAGAVIGAAFLPRARR